MAKSAPKLGGGTATLDATAFEAGFNMPLVHETVRAELNARRQGTASTKTRGQVSGGGAKPWRQKGTGRARAGSSRSPVWTGGGTLVAWSSLIAVAGFARVPVFQIVQTVMVPVLIGLATSTLCAVLIWH